jgi:hypothetical protein
MKKFNKKRLYLVIDQLTDKNGKFMFRHLPDKLHLNNPF